VICFSKHHAGIKRTFPLFANLLVVAVLSAADLQGLPPTTNATPGDKMLTDYFRNETAALSARCLSNVNTLEDWTAKRSEYRRQLQEMLGLWPMPERTDLKPIVTGVITNEEFTVEKISFQASPGLYCTANLFVPKNLSKPAPTILYECGHIRSVTNGVSVGNKGFYQTDGAWFARNGYVCFVLDTVLAGEIQGIHTGTRDRGLWWWNSRGYTPAGVEAWFGIRALDYLCTRPEVDTNRFGITGHSGGGAYSWTVTALDDRIKAAAPLAGMADVQSHILDGVIDSHCDCNFFINIYRWDFPQLAALAAPRPLLIGGTDHDQLFHLDNTERIYEKVRRIYQLYDASNKLGLALAPGVHDEVPELQLAVLRWFNRYLKGEEKPVEMAAKKFFAPIDLKVFETLPTDAINTNIAETFVPRAMETGSAGVSPARPAETRRRDAGAPKADELCAVLRKKVFAGWPDDGLPLDLKSVFSVAREGVRFSAWDFTSEHDVTLRLYLLEDAKARPAATVQLKVLDQGDWNNWLATAGAQFGDTLASELSERRVTQVPNQDGDSHSSSLRPKGGFALGFFAPRGIGLTAWSGDDKRLTRIRRRFMLLGQTLDGMRVWDIRRAIQTLQSVRDRNSVKVELLASGGESVNTLYATLFEPEVRRLDLVNLPKSQMEGPDYLGVLKVTDIPQVSELVAAQSELKVETK
jgi:dienelactone hydrolase